MLVRWAVSEFLDRRWLFFPRIFFALQDSGRCSLPTAYLGADWFGALSYSRFLKRKSTMVSIHHHVDFYRGIGMFPVLGWGESERLTDCTSLEKVMGSFEESGPACRPLPSTTTRYILVGISIILKEVRCSCQIIRRKSSHFHKCLNIARSVQCYQKWEDTDRTMGRLSNGECALLPKHQHDSSCIIVLQYSEKELKELPMMM